MALSKQVSTVAVHPAESADAMLPKDLNVSALTRTVTLDNETALAPITAGDRLGDDHRQLRRHNLRHRTPAGRGRRIRQPLPVPAPRHRRNSSPSAPPASPFWRWWCWSPPWCCGSGSTAATAATASPGSKQYRHHSYRGRRH